MTPHDYWDVRIAIPDEDRGRALLGGLAQAVPRERFILLTFRSPDGDDEHTTLHVQVDAPGADEAAERATELYRKARQAAGIRDAEVHVLGVMSPIFGNRVDTLRAEAVALLQDHRPDLAVVRAQTACELWAKQAIAGVFRARLGRDSGELAARQCRASMSDRRTRQLIEALTGHEPGRQRWWKAYDAHLQRRHAVVHDGVLVSEEHAAESLAAVHECIEWLRLLWAGERATAVDGAPAYLGDLSAPRPYRPLPAEGRPRPG